MAGYGHVPILVKMGFGREGGMAMGKREGIAAGSGPVLFGEAGLCNGTALRKATRRVSQLYDEILAPCGLRSTQRSILVHIARGGGAPTMGELAAALVLDRSALAHNLKPLERDGLVVVAVDPADKRSRLIRLTREGEAKLAESTALWARAQHRFETAFGAEAARALRGSLAQIASAEFGQAFAEAGG
jgi:DNA-binding MarR family transcriptional regulator